MLLTELLAAGIATNVTNIANEVTDRTDADSYLQGQIDDNDSDITTLNSGLAAEQAARQFGDAVNNNSIGALQVNLNTEIENREDADASLDAYDAVLLGMIEGIAGSEADVAAIVEANDFFDASGNTVSLEAPYTAITADNVITSSVSTNSLAAQNADLDAADIQNLTIETDMTSPSGTITAFDATTVEVYSTLEVDGATTLNSTLNVSGETTLGADVSVTGNVSVSGNVSASDATTAGQLASKGQMDAADAVLQGQISSNDTDIATNASGVAANLSAIESNDTDIAANLSAIQSNDTDIATNASGVAANLSSIGSNDTDIAANLSAIQSNDTDIATNASGVAANLSSIGSNDTDIATNASGVAANLSSIGSNDTDIAANLSAIQSNDTDIATNASGVAANLSSIGSNDTDIATNASGVAANLSSIGSNDTDIATNASGVAANLSSIGSNDTDIAANLSAIQSNDTDIATNASGVAANLSSIGSNDTDIATNASGVAANLSSIGSNDTDIAANLSAIQSNDTDIATNASGVAANLSSIGSNDTDIATNASGVAANLSSIGSNDTDIATNASGVAANLSSIGSNDTDIATNASGVAANLSSIGSNDTDIATNASGVAANLSSIGSNDTDIAANLSAIQSNDTDIATNASGVAANLSSIGSNDTDIATNASGVAANLSSIGSNDADIATNASGVAANLSSIGSNDTDIAANLSAIQSNDTDIATNASGVAANLSSIGSNDTDIAANLSAIQSNDTDITNLQSELDATQTGAGLGTDGSYTSNATNYAATATSLAGADADLDAALKQEETDRIANDFWNLAAGVLTPDAGITDVDMTGVDLAVNDIQANDVAASTLYAPNATVSTLQTVNGSVQDLSGQDIAYTNANFTNFTVFGPTSSADIDGTLNVDGATTLSGTTMNGDLDLNGSADISGTLGVTGMITGNLTGNVTGQVSDISNHDTDDLSEGPTNLYYTDARSRAAVSVTDAGGDGSLSYDNATGVITYTGVSAAETRAHFTGGTGVTITAGEVAIGQDVATTANVTFASVNAAISGDLTGDVLSADGQVTVLDGGTDGTDATFTGDVTGDVTGNAGTVTNGVYTTSSVTALNDVTSAGSGSIITGTERTKLNGIETAATADQTDAEIKTAYENNANTNAFEDADETKLDGVEASADVTDATNVTAAGALMDSELTDLAGVKAVTISTLQVKPSEGAFVDGDKTKLDGIETAATADQTDAEIKTAYENNANTNAFEDADETKLDGVEASADVTDATNVTAAGALMDSELTDLAGVKAVTISTLQVKPSEGAFVDGDKTKLDGIETAATADQTDAEIKTAYENNANTNAFEDADETKLDGVEASADVTDATNVEAAGALMDSELADLAGVKAVTISTLQVKPSEGAFADGDKTKLDGLEAGATADMTDAEIKTAYENNADTNAFEDADETKLDGVEASADVTDATNVTAAGALMDSELTDLAGVKAVTISTLQVKPSEGAFVDGDKTKLDGIETAATADQTDAEIKTAYENNANTNAFEDADETKLDGIEALADVTDATNVAAAGAVMNTGDETIAGTKTFSSAIASTVTTGTAPFTVASTTMVANLNADQLDGQEGSYYTDFSNQVVDASEVTNTMVADDLTIDGGTINSTPIGQTTAAAGDFTAVNVEGAALVNELRGTGNVFEVYDSNVGSALTVNADGSVYVEDLNINSSFSLTGNMQAGFFTTTAGDPTLDNQLARKAYVDGLTAALQSELDDTQTGAGLNGDGDYIVDGTTNYLTAATSLADADDKLDAQAKTNADGIAANGTNIANNGLNITTLDNTTVKLTGDQTIAGVKTFTSTIGGSIDGNAATVTNGVYTTSSVTVLNDVSSAGSGAIIETGERNKLTAIESLADVTDATNVEAAGALMDSELADLAGVKAVTISTLQVKPSEGAFADGDKTKLDGIEASADVTDATNVAAAGAVMNAGDQSIAGVKTFTSTIGGSIDGNAATVTNGRYTTDAQVFDYTVTSNQSNPVDLIEYAYYLNGANVFYQHETAGDADVNAGNGYTFTLVGSNLPTSTNIQLYLRGQANDIAVDADSKFSLSYNQVVALNGASGQTSGGMVLNLVVDGMHTGVQFHFHLDDTSTAPDSSF